MVPVIDLADVSFVGAGLVRPECVLVTAAGNIYTSDWRGGVAHLRPDGTQVLYAGTTADLPEGPRPNGIALEQDGSFLFANLGTEIGGVWRLDRTGQIRPVLTEMDGEPIPPSNFVVRDASGRLWLTVSTRLRPRSRDYRRSASTGFIVLLDERGARIVADGLGFTNECLVDPTGSWLYVNETYARRLSRFPLSQDGDLGPKQVVAEFGTGQYPDGMAFDTDGNVWIAGIISNQLLRVEPSTGQIEIVLEDSDRAHVAWVEAAYESGTLDRPHMDTIVSTKLRNISSIAFGGADLTTAYLGCLLGDAVAIVRMPVRGVAPVHWHFDHR
ncbi:SMP-30/gluconolactonase/LRE family protein [Microvirga massiliensis]|uniref:SMP-30/gluconolactonase/LRE family protein n=1 Tax=Microvirga massiliensis TaxID=1033741 RepID=UPI00062BAB91|nr:SMP-30/gluconolactonase/LRE family protein [Microvirga massiliensis]